MNPGAGLQRPGGHGGLEGLVSALFDFCRVDLGLAEATAKEYKRKIRRFFQAVNKPAESVTAEDVRSYLKPLADGNANSYGNALKPLKAVSGEEIRGSLLETGPQKPVLRVLQTDRCCSRAFLLH